MSSGVGEVELVVVAELPVEDLGELAFETEQGFGRGLGIGDLPLGVVAAVRGQPQQRSVVLNSDRLQVGSTLSDQCDADGVQLVGLAAVALLQQPGTRCQLGPDIEDRLSGSHQMLGDEVPQPFWRPRQPTAAGAMAVPRPAACRRSFVGGYLQPANDGPGRVDGHRGVRATMRVEPNDDHLSGSFRDAVTAGRAAAGNLSSGTGVTPLSSHAAGSALAGEHAMSEPHPRVGKERESLVGHRPHALKPVTAGPRVYAAFEQVRSVASPPLTSAARPSGSPSDQEGDKAMVVLGIDAHKRTHTVVAVDAAGRQLGIRVTKATSTAAHLDLVRWAVRFGPQRLWAVQDCRHLSRRLKRDLLAAGEQIVRVPPKLMAHARDAARSYGKSDPIDALAVARAALRKPGLPAERLDGSERELRLLTDHREDLVGERTWMICRLRWHLHELDPDWDPGPRSLRSRKNLAAVAARLAGLTGPFARLAADLTMRVVALTTDIHTLEQEISALAGQLTPSLLALPGVAGLTAAKIVAETADARRFKSKDAYARHSGTAPLPVWSVNQIRPPPPSAGLPQDPHRGRQHQDRGAARPQAAPVRHRLPSTPGRRRTSAHEPGRYT